MHNGLAKKSQGGNTYKSALGFFWFFLLLFSYYILRPIREQIGSLGGTENLSFLFWLALLAMLVCIPIFSFFVSHLHRRLLVPVVYAFFAGSLVFFHYQLGTGSEADQVWLGRAFFVFISMYGVFLVSFFWSVVGDMFSRSQSGNLFGVIAGGGTIGGIAGSQFARFFVEKLGINNLLLVPAIALGLAVFVYFLLEGMHFTQTQGGADVVKGAKDGRGTGGNPFAGFREVFKSSFLLQIAVFVSFMGACSTAVYFQQAEIVKEHFTTVVSGSVSIEAATTKYFATINLFVSLLTVFIQLFVFRALYNRFGVSFCLVVLPCMYVVGLFCLGVAPSIEVLSVVGVLGRSCEYGIFNPSKEGLFTVVSRSERYKAKSFIDTIMRRSGDSMVGSVYQTLRETLYVPGFAVAFGTIPIAAWMTYLGYSIGKKTERISTGLAD